MFSILMADKVMKRLPAVEKTISDIDPQKDIRVRITGTVIDSKDNSIMIDDGSGQVKVLFEKPESFVREGQFIRVVTRVLPVIDGFECRGEAVQDLENFDINLYKDAKKIIGR